MPQEAEEPFLMDLIHAIIANDKSQVTKLLSANPSLAKAAVKIGATRQQSTDYFFNEIEHYIYGGDTALHAAAAANNVEIAKSLLGMSADICAKNRRGAEPLHYASDSGPWNANGQENMITFLLESGANPNAIDKNGVAPLHRAVRKRSTAAVRALLAGGANIRFQNKNGSTPLHLAVQNTGSSGSGSPESKAYQIEIIKLLLKNGANPEDKDANGKTVRQWIKEEAINHLFE